MIFVHCNFQNRKVFQDKDKGIIISGNSLALQVEGFTKQMCQFMMEMIQKIQRENGGDYFCTATNIIGRNQSQSLHLDVKCESMSLHLK